MKKYFCFLCLLFLCTSLFHTQSKSAYEYYEPFFQSIRQKKYFDITMLSLIIRTNIDISNELKQQDRKNIFKDIIDSNDINTLNSLRLANFPLVFWNNSLGYDGEWQSIYSYALQQKKYNLAYQMWDFQCLKYLSENDKNIILNEFLYSDLQPDFVKHLFRYYGIGQYQYYHANGTSDRGCASLLCRYLNDTKFSKIEYLISELGFDINAISYDCRTADDGSDIVIYYTCLDLYQNNELANKFRINLDDKNTIIAFIKEHGGKTIQDLVKTKTLYDLYNESVGLHPYKVNTDILNVRELPTQNSKVIEQLYNGNVGLILFNDFDKQTIDSMTDYWYCVYTENKKIGWIFGGYINRISKYDLYE